MNAAFYIFLCACFALLFHAIFEIFRGDSATSILKTRIRALETRLVDLRVRLLRDLNAAINLRNLAGSSPVSTCGETSAGRSGNATVKLVSAKQEPNTIEACP